MAPSRKRKTDKPVSTPGAAADRAAAGGAEAQDSAPVRVPRKAGASHAAGSAMGVARKAGQKTRTPTLTDLTPASGGVQKVTLVPRGEPADPGERARRVWQQVVTNQLETILLVFDKPSEVARILGVSPSQMTRWRRDQLPDQDNRDRIRRLADIVALLMQRFRPSVAADWLRAPNLHEMDGGGSPLELIRTGRWDVLRAYAEEAVSEAYG